MLKGDQIEGKLLLMGDRIDFILQVGLHERGSARLIMACWLLFL